MNKLFEYQIKLKVRFGVLFAKISYLHHEKLFAKEKKK